MTVPNDPSTDPTESETSATQENPETPRSRSRSRSTGATRTRTRRRADDGGSSEPSSTTKAAADEAGTDDGAEDESPARGRKTSGRKTSGRRTSGRKTSGRKTTKAAEDADAATEAPADADAPKARSARSRGGAGRSGGSSGAKDAEQDAPTGDDTGSDRDASDDEDSGESGDGSRRRRRRGRRGRGGRGRGGRGGSGSGGGNDRGGGGGRDDGGRRSDTGRDEDADGGPDDESDKSSHPGDESVEAAMAKGGTRLAAKRGRRDGSRGSGGGNGGGNGRGRGQRPGGVSEEVRRAILEGPPRTMLVTARADRTQIAVLEDRTVVEHYVTRKEDVTYVGNIYMARVQNVLPGMEAAFLDIGKGRNGVLYAGEVLYDELDLEEGAEERIENVLKPGQKVLVQVTKDPMGSKGPRLTMHLSLAGRYMVLAPNSDLFGISRKLTDRERDRLRKLVKKVKPSEHGVIVRTAAEGATDEQITADLERLLAKWQRVEEAAEGAKALTTVYEEPPLVVKVIRDNFGPEFERCIVDDEELFTQVRDYLGEVAPELLDKVELYGAPTTDARSKAAGAPSADGASPADDADAEAAPGKGDGKDKEPDPEVRAELASGEIDFDAARERRKNLESLFDAYDVSDQLRKAMGRKVWLPSGGYLIIETTEAMKVIDVNTGKFTGGNDTNLEEVVLKTNLEAADEIVRQLRLRDMGGIIVIDFIDMLLKSNQEQVVRRLKRELLRDRTKTRVSDVSKLGLVQMTRKNVSQGLIESFSHTCKECEGRGLISEID
ncbi:MAG: ribonuclease E/G [Egicoccus sp.]